MISVIIPTYNRPHLLNAALQSVHRQAYQDTEIIVINDGGCRVEDVTSSWTGRLRIKLYNLPGRSGASHARNVGVEHAGGKYIAFLDDDDLFLKNHLQAAHHLLEREHLQFFYTGAYVAGTRIARIEDIETDNCRRKFFSYDRQFLDVANFIHTGSVVTSNFRRTAARFDDRLSHCEDWDMWLRLVRDLKFSVGCIDTIETVYHQIADTEGLVSTGQAVVPSLFSTARKRIYTRWAAGCDLVAEYRQCLLFFDAECDRLVAAGHKIKLGAFERSLKLLHRNFVARRAPPFAEIRTSISEGTSGTCLWAAG
ncbi:glycosyltransferase involved in cell wall biosynthesis [Bradyrhizobium macuxiense]|uniref:Glycosyltransferase involved in cell wall biosynthesis n=1 Tax=Bradyrhizobium macuxiense TaxID=1755647 RepID=A0A560KUL4_9BRAD|nr:glycosyltransferase family A protein [Bradyrhizobium macuxiense]TWB86892.1 glycosyltransferase involved in cell wall biosynthesis [Bradyrhizobium macuxiense]